MWDERRGRVVAALQRQGRHTVLFHQTLAERVGLNATDTRTLAYLEEAGPATAGQLAEWTGLTTGAVTGIIDRLERKGFVHREADPSDRRKVLVVRTPDSEGSRQMAELFQDFGRGVAALLARFTDDELTVIARFAEESAAVMRDATAKLLEE